MDKKILAVFALILLCAGNTFAQDDNCYSVVAGRLTTADGSVLFGHNEDNGPQFVSRMVRRERRYYGNGEMFRLEHGGQIPQADSTFEYLLLEIPGKGFSNALLNECGVAVASDLCPSREDMPELIEGGIGTELRVLVAERASSARQAVHLVGSLVERLGYNASGRTLTICDRNEGWLLAMVHGRHWVAQRVPDDQVAVIANTYTIHEVDLSDTLNFLGSADLIEYAEERGWYDPSADGRFDFTKAYSDQARWDNFYEGLRQWSGYRHLLDELSLCGPITGKLPFSVKPERKLAQRDIFAILRDRYEGTAYENPDPCHPERWNSRPISMERTNSGSVFVLRKELPIELGALWWLALWEPDAVPFVPLYWGMKGVPYELDFDVSRVVYKIPDAATQPGYEKACRVFRDFYLAVYDDPCGLGVEARESWAEFEANCIAEQAKLEKNVLKNLNVDRASADEEMTKYCRESLAHAMRLAAGKIYK